MTEAVTKGRITIVATGEFREFTYNPRTIKGNHGFEFPSMKIPGGSVPLLQGGAGKDLPIKFTLELDGERGYLNRRRGAGNENLTLDISDELNWYLAMTYSEGGGLFGDPNSLPPVVLFTFGPFFRGVPCVVEDVDYEIKSFTGTLAPRRADVSISLKQRVTSSPDRSNVYSTARSRNF